MKKTFFLLSFLFIFPLNINAAVTNTTGGLGATTDTGLPPGYTSQNDMQGNTMTVPVDQMTTGGIPQTSAPTNYFDTLNQEEQNKNVSSESFLSQIVPLNKLGLTEGNQPLNNLLNQLFYVGLVAAVILAIVMIIRGGVEYMTIDAITSKENGKNRVKAALGGLLLAFSAILILNTINPGLTSLKIVFSPLANVNSVAIETDIYNAISTYTGLTSEQYQEFLKTGKIPTNISPTAQRVLAEALNSINKMKTGTEEGIFEGTEFGNKACAAAVNAIFQKATGQYVGGGTSVPAMYDSLQKDPRFELVSGGVTAAQPGDIIISPNGDRRHVGFIAPGGTIISNSSTNKVVQDHFNTQKWTNFYGSSNTFIYRPK